MKTMKPIDERKFITDNPMKANHSSRLSTFDKDNVSGQDNDCANNSLVHRSNFCCN